MVSNAYDDESKIPNNGLYAKGNIQTAGVFVGNLTGNANTASKLQTPRQIALTGAVTGNVNFDGSANANIATSLSANTLNDIGLGTFLKSETGYTKLPNGFILQWGVTSSVFDERKGFLLSTHFMLGRFNYQVQRTENQILPQEAF